MTQQFYSYGIYLTEVTERDKEKNVHSSFFYNSTEVGATQILTSSRPEKLW